MKKMLLSCILFSFFVAPPAWGATFESLSSSPQILRSVENQTQGFTQVEHCRNQTCIRYPSDQTLERLLLSGLTTSWEKIFADCRQFSSLNQMYTYTNLLATVASFWNVGGAVRATQTVKYAVRSLGGVGRVLGSRIVFDSAVTVAGSQLLALPANLTDTNGLPYPDISEEEVNGAGEFLEVLLNDSAHYFPPENIIEAASQVIGICSSQAYQRSLQTHISGCLRGCHGSTTQPRAPTARQLSVPTYLGLPPTTSDNADRDAILEYLNAQ